MIICIGLIAISLKNIYGIVERGYQRFQFIQTENERFNDLFRENARLQEDLQYYSSYEYIEYKAREELNLVYPGSKLLYVNRSPEDIERIELASIDREPSKTADPQFHRWVELILD
jgi:cell division protein FtsB